MQNPLKNRINLILLTGTIVLSCGPTDLSNIKKISVDLERIKSTDVLLVSDHTLPQHLNLDTAGANGEERIFIDPTLERLREKLLSRGLNAYILNVEDLTVDGEITDEDTFEAAYALYDEVLNVAVMAQATIVAIHYDADLIPAENYGKNAAYASAEEDGEEYGYVGGIQLILDERSTSEATLRLANQIIHQDKILDQLHEVGFRIRPGYDGKVRFQANQTMNISGHSAGGSFLLEIAPQDQAVRLYGTPNNIVRAIDGPLSSLADTINYFRKNLM
ncbi:MAG: hypothetical protein ACO3NC_02615 [Pseudohongiellaceae bacterium]|jgi:hypothetical protein